MLKIGNKLPTVPCQARWRGEVFVKEQSFARSTLLRRAVRKLIKRRINEDQRARHQFDRGTGWDQKPTKASSTAPSLSAVFRGKTNMLIKMTFLIKRFLLIPVLFGVFTITFSDPLDPR